LAIDAGMRRVIDMNIKKVREIVKEKGVDIRVGRKKEDMIRDYQMIEGYSPCFHTKDSCAEDCLWKEDCLNV
jgi:hypothetical protein